MRVLLVEDDPYLGMMMKELFEARSYKVTLCTDGECGFEKFGEIKPDICVLDVMLPLSDGFTLAKQIRQVDKLTPIIFTTARSMKEDVMKGFNLGADDYLKKPFSMEELLVRVKAILRRTKGLIEDAETQSYKIGIFNFNHQRQELSGPQGVQRLSGREADLLKMFIDNKNQLLDKQIVLKMLWGDDSFFNGRSMDVFVTKIRKYLKEDSRIEIINIRGKGYKLMIDSD
jgi:DNA-binding response OmpR family regulator